MPLQEEPIHSLHVTSPSISSLTDLPIKYSQRLQRAGFTTASEVILIHPDRLRSLTGLCASDVPDLCQCLAEICSPKVLTISERISQTRQQFISLGSPDLDRLFGEPPTGIPTGLISEITGESSSGKTCMSLQLSLNVQLPYDLGGLQGGCIYLCTESAFPSTRLHQMATGLRSRLKTSSQLTGQNSPTSLDTKIEEMISGLSVEDLMENVHLLRVHDPQTLIHTIHYSLPAFLEKQNKKKHNKANGNHPETSKPIKLIVLDSIGAIFRTDVAQSKGNNVKFRMTERAAEMNQVADGLKFLASLHQLAVVVVNQVSDVIDASSSSLHNSHLSAPIGRVSISKPSSIREDSSSSLALENDSPTTARNPTSSLSLPSSSSTSLTKNHLEGPSLIPLDYNQQARHFTGQKDTNNRKEAALGFVWTNAINIRIMLNKLNAPLNPSSLDKQLGLANQQEGSLNAIKHSSLSIRTAVLVFSPFGTTPKDATGRGIRFVIHSLGIISVKNLS